jgi:hypothetical protein
MSAESNAAYAAPGYLVFHREATLFGQAFDPNTLALAGDPFRVADGLGFNVGNGRGSFGVSQNGVLLYAKGQGGLAGRGQIPNFPAAVNNWGWVDRTGRRMGSVHEPGNYADMDLSPDGTRMAITRQETGASTADIWVVDMERAGVPARLTLDADDDLNPVWSPDGRIAFTSFRKGNADIYVGAADRPGTETPVLESAENEWVEDWSKDGRYIAFRFGAPPFEDIYAVATSGDRKPFPVVQGRFRKDEPQFSYDGKWLAYASDKTGAFQVYVTSFPAADQEIQISKDGGGQPRWRRDGRELFYRGSTDMGIHAVDLTLGASPKAAVPKRLTTAPSGTETMNPVRHLWSVSPDGKRFLVRYPNSNAPGGGGGVPLAPVTVSQAAGAGGISPIFVDLTIIRHWTAAAGGQN